jgi:very-short-patch-repair endonuclease
MALAHPEQRRKLLASGARVNKTRAEREYIARLVAPEAIFAFVRAYGGGDPAAAWVAGHQLELVSTAQLYATGLDKDRIATRRRRGTLHRRHRGVYLFGSPMMLPGARELAAVMAGGENTWVTHRAAAALLRLADPADDVVDVTTTRRFHGDRTMRVHVVDELDPADHHEHNGIPITAPARTILDFASQATPYELERAIAEAYARRLVTEAELRAAIARAPRRAGARTLRAELEREGGPQWSHSEAERRMLQLIRAAGLPAPQMQRRIAGWPADFLWPEERLIVEVDGFQFHGHRAAFERDRRRDQTHAKAGYQVIRFTFRQLDEEPLTVVATIALALGRRTVRA